MTNKEAFEWFAFIIGVLFFVWLSLPVVCLLLSVGNFISSFVPKKKYSDAEIDRIFGNNFVPANAIPVTKKIPVEPRHHSSINNGSSVKEYRLPDGSMVAFDCEKVDVSERSAI